MNYKLKNMEIKTSKFKVFLLCLVIVLLPSCLERGKDKVDSIKKHSVQKELTAEELKKKLSKKAHIEKDYFSHKYKYLNDDYTINVDSDEFERAIVEYGFIRDRIHAYKDSLAVALMLEFNDWNFVRVGKMHLAYQWERVGYHTLMTEEEAENYFMKLGYRYPYKAVEALRADNISDVNLLNIIERIKKELLIINPSLKLNELSNKNLLNLALRLNPSRIEDAMKSKCNNDGVGCGKPNCCKNKDKHNR